MEYYALGIRKAQKELGLQVEIFPNLDMRDDDTKETTDEEESSSEDDVGYESATQRAWRERMEKYY